MKPMAIGGVVLIVLGLLALVPCPFRRRSGLPRWLVASRCSSPAAAGARSGALGQPLSLSRRIS